MINRRELSEIIINRIDCDNRFEEVKCNPLQICNWETPEFLELHKPISEKSLAKVRVKAYREDPNYGLNIIIELYPNSYCEWYTCFDGWIEEEYELDNIFKQLGIDY